MVDPLALSVGDAQRLVGASLPDDVKAALAYIEGDVWQEGRGWVGPRLSTGSTGATALLDEIKRGLAGANLIRDLVGRHASGVLGKEPSWDLPGVSAADQDVLTAWWDRVVLSTPDDQPPSVAGGVVGVALVRALCGDVPVLRLRVTGGPDAPAPASLEDALARVALEVLPSTAAVVLNELDEGPMAVALLQANARSLAARLGRMSPTQAVEIVTLDAAGGTVIVVGTASGEQGVPDAMQFSTPLPLGGRLTMAELRVPPLVTGALLGIQRQLTKTLTVMGRNTDVAGFVERIFLNAMRPGREVADATAPGGKRFEPAPYQAGPGTANWLVGVQDAEGNPVTPGAIFRDPVSPATFLDTAAGLTFYGHKEARQLHALIAGDAAPSGESRRQAAADFLGSLGPSKLGVEALTRWLLETAYALALALRGQRVSDGLRAVVTCQLSGTLPTVEEVKELREGVSGKLLRRATYQTAAGVADTTAEDEAIEEERAAAPPPPPVVAQNGATPPATTPAMPEMPRVTPENDNAAAAQQPAPGR